MNLSGKSLFKYVHKNQIKDKENFVSKKKSKKFSDLVQNIEFKEDKS